MFFAVHVSLCQRLTHISAAQVGLSEFQAYGTLSNATIANSSSSQIPLTSSASVSSVDLALTSTASASSSASGQVSLRPN